METESVRDLDPGEITGELRTRLRRLRTTPSVRALLRETDIPVGRLILPIFVRDGITEPEPIESMPGVFRQPLNRLGTHAKEVAAMGIGAVALFPVVEPELKSEGGEEALRPGNLACRAIGAIRDAVPDLVVIADLALDPYTIHGHDGIVDPGSGTVCNDETVAVLCEMAVLHAAAGAQWVAPSDMMDGRVMAIRRTLDRAGRTDTAILAYAAKFNSAYYGPFRDAIGSRRVGGYLDKGSYQLDPANRREAIREALLDAAEGADILMVKPAGPYLDIIRDIRGATQLPLAAYQVSGEYAQIVAAAERGWLDRERARDESILAIRRAGADLILTYFAIELAKRSAERG